MLLACLVNVRASSFWDDQNVARNINIMTYRILSETEQHDGVLDIMIDTAT